MRVVERLARGRKATLSLGGTGRPFVQPSWWARPDDEPDHDFATYIERGYKANGVVFACILVRLALFSEARFQFQRLSGGRPGELFGTPALSILEQPWPNGTTGELLARMEQDVSLAGNFYATVVDDRIRRLRPDWVSIVTTAPKRADGSDGSPYDLGAKVGGYMYAPRGGSNIPDPVLLTPDQVCHWSPIPDPDCQWRGMSWLTPVLSEIAADSAATKHKLKYFENGTVGGLAVTYAPDVEPEAVQRFAELWKEQHAGVDNAYKTFHLGGGADAKALGADLRQLEFKTTQGAGETRIAAASGVGAVMAQLSEGMQGSSLNAGNYTAARRRLADGFMRPQWRSAAAALSSLVTVPPGSRLWYDARDISFLQEDAADESKINAANAGAIQTLITSGFEADAAVAAVLSGDLSRLAGNHSGLYSVQLQPPGTEQQPKASDAPGLKGPIVLQSAPIAGGAEEAASVTVLNIDARTTVEPPPAPSVTVQAPAPPPAPEVTVIQAPPAAPEVTVVQAPPLIHKTTRRIIRDKSGHIIRIEED